MTAKTSTYARKRAQRAAQGLVRDGLEGMRLLDACRPYSEDADGGVSATIAPLIRVNDAYASITTAEEPAPEHLDLLAHAIGVSIIRSEQIAAEGPNGHLLMEPLLAAHNALARCKDRHAQGKSLRLDALGVQDVRYGLDLYEQLLLSSSAAQMNAAVTERINRLEKP